MKRLHAFICGRWRPLVVLVVLFILWGASVMGLIVRENSELNKFEHIRIGMSKKELVEIIGEPHAKNYHKDNSWIPPETMVKNKDFVEYSYAVNRIGSRSGLIISGIYVNNSEEVVVFIRLSKEIADAPGGLAVVFLVFTAYGGVALLIWMFLRKWCGNRRIDQS